AWLGGRRFGRGEVRVSARSRTDYIGTVMRGTAGVQGIAAGAPLDLWFAGDTGVARNTLLRAHPLLDGGEMRVERLGRRLLFGSIEAQRWWPVAGVVRVAGAMFVDVAGTQLRAGLPNRANVDVGAGA